MYCSVLSPQMKNNFFILGWVITFGGVITFVYATLLIMISKFLCITDMCMYGVLGFAFYLYQIILLSLVHFKVNLVILIYIKIHVLQHFTQRATKDAPCKDKIIMFLVSILNK